MKEREKRRGESRYVLWVSNDREREKKQERGKTENVEGEVLRQNEKTQGEEECESVAGEQTQCDFKEACGW